MNEPQLKTTTQRRLTDRPLEEMWLTEFRLGEARRPVIRLFEAAIVSSRRANIEHQRIRRRIAGKTTVAPRDTDDRERGGRGERTWKSGGDSSIIDSFLGCPASPFQPT